jgi:hypothetical protein
MKLSNVLIAVFVIVFGSSLAFSQGKCETSYLTSPADWSVADAGSVPYTVVTRVPVRDHNVECEFNVYVDQRHFNLDDLKQIGDRLHKAYQPLCCILVRITTSKNELIGTAVALKKGLSSLVLLPTDEYKALPKPDAPGTQVLKAVYHHGRSSIRVSYDRPDCPGGGCPQIQKDWTLPR